MSNFRPMNLNLDYSAWWLLLVVFISLGLTYLSYFNKKGFEELSNGIKSAMLISRFLSLFLLGFLLLGVLFNTSNERLEKPIFFVVTDNSKSMLNYKDSASVLKDLNTLRSKLKKDFGESITY